MRPSSNPADTARECRPRSVRRRTAAVVTAGLALAVLPGATPGAAQDLDDRKQQVERNIEQTEEHLQHSSRALVAAARRLEAAEAELAAARSRHARTQGELAAAQALDHRMQVELAAAVEALE
ncbi:MAG TPA: hypothetical protein VFG97_06205, partial [Pedococcus sp.]|nr:hypothetical protein [Pedococcus sp.]